ncbi:MAG TPA: glutamyl-tRNA reductase [Acidimicrobiales bacterium]|nr:glutamyl-tRNA reductase [Acidimicrobiales bacterium]
MSVAIVGINHRTVPLEALEPLIIGPADLPKALGDLSSRSHLDEVVVLSTCMRTEVYALVNRFHGAMADIREFLATWSGQAPEEFAGNLYSYFDDAAISHLFRVASGLDSASLGEPEVLGQVRRAAEVARREGACGPVLGGAFRHALEVGKRARTETAISRGVTSLAHAAVELAAQALGGLAGKKALVLGSGEVGRQAAQAFAQMPGALPVLVASRARSRADHLARAVGGTAIGWERVPAALEEVDVVASATTAEAIVLTGPNVEQALQVHGEPGRPLLLVDLAVPRNIDPSFGALSGVTLLDMNDVAQFVAEQMKERRAEIPLVERIITEEVSRYASSVAARSVAPLVSAVHDRAEEVRRSEVARFLARSEELAPDEVAAIDLLTKRVVAKLLHEPTVRLKAAAGTAKGEALTEAFRDLFDLEP